MSLEVKTKGLQKNSKHQKKRSKEKKRKKEEDYDILS
jgi:hypothetical protein